MLAAIARASSVLPTPGTSSIRTCPSARSATTASLMTSGFPRTTEPTFSSSRFNSRHQFVRGRGGRLDRLGCIHAMSFETRKPHHGHDAGTENLL